MASPTSPSGADVPPVLPSIPLAPETARPAGEQTIGGLVRDVSTQLSNLVRAEVELAKAEVTAEVRKGVTGSVFFAVAAAIGLFSLFFFFFALAELLSLWLLRWVAFAIVFVLMVLGAGAVRVPRLPEGSEDPQAGADDREPPRVRRDVAAPGPFRRASRAGRPQQRVVALTGPRGGAVGAAGPARTVGS